MEYKIVEVYINDRIVKFATNQHSAENQNSIKIIDNNYFQGITEILSSENINNDYVHYSLFSNYFLAFETMFSLLGAVAQSPYYFYGWLLKYRNTDLYEVINKISNSKPLKNPYNRDSLSWDDISEIIHPGTIDDNRQIIQKDFALVWKKLAEEYLTKDFQDIYNSIKHGLRAKPDGILQLTIEDHKFQGSDYGFKFGFTEEVNGVNLIKYRTVNVDKELIESVFAIAHSTINNIREFLKSVNVEGKVSVTQYPLVHESVIEFLNTKRSSIVSMTTSD